MTNGAAIEIAGLRKVYSKGRDRVDAVNGLDLEVRRGEVFGLLGPNGAGKTTTVEICEGLLEPTSGSVVVLGQTWSGPRQNELRQRIGVSLQETSFFDKQTVWEIVALFHSFYDDGPGHPSVEDCVELLGLREKAQTQTRHLSGGQRQRLAVACALVGKPELLFLDEPTTGLDPQSRRRLWEVIRGFKDAGGTVLLTTHYMDEAAQLCDRVGVVDRGKLIALGSPAELTSSLGGDHVVEVVAPGVADVADGIGELPGVRAHRVEASVLTLTVEAPHVTLPALLDRIEQRGIEMDALTTRHTSLEDVFVNLTGRQLRDEG